MPKPLVSLVLALPLAAGLSSCETVFPPPPEELDLWLDASSGVIDYELKRLCELVWEADLRHDPFRATRLGDPRYHGSVPQTSLAARNAHKLELEDFRQKLRTILAGELAPGDQLTGELLAQHLSDAIAEIDRKMVEWNVDPLAGPHIEVLNLTRFQPTGTARERAQLVERWRKLPGFLRQSANNLLYGKAGGRVPSRMPVVKSLGQLDGILATHPFDSPLVKIAAGGGRFIDLPPGGSVSELAHRHLGDSRKQTLLRTLNPHLNEPLRVAGGTRVLLAAPDDPLTPEERGELLADCLRAVELGVRPAMEYYREVLRDKILPATRPDDEPGLLHVPGGQVAYRQLIHHHTSLPLEECDPRVIHEFGLAEVERIRSEIAVLGERLFGTSNVAQIQERLRTDPDMHFATRDEVEAKAVECLARATAVMPRYFGILPEADCVVVRIPAHEEKDSTIAYYNEPAPDGTRPGIYYINTYAPTTRPRYEAEVLAYHEAIPGHHLQIAIAQELEGLPLFRRHGGSTAFIEGWALYTERLCDEMGLYTGDLDRIGVLSFDAWRASRLVVDTGLHAFGWSREEAIDFMVENTLLARNNIENEVDRYIAWPGQALAYKIGQRELLQLRDEARQALGNAFDYRDFHDVVLENGAVTLSSLRGIVARWLTEG